MSEALSLLENCLEYEKLLTNLKSDAKDHRDEILKIQKLLRNGYRRILVEFPSFSSTYVKDVDTMLWKQCFYKPIEEYRRNIKRVLQIASLVATDSSQKQAVEKAKLHLARLSTALSNFIIESQDFYQELMNNLENTHRSSGTKSFDIINCTYRCLLYLGDLSRYKELYTHDSSKDYIEATKYYERACFLAPKNGNPQNQLAVLATYKENEFEALYHYCRSLLVKQPFTVADENLKLFFEKIPRIVNQNNEILSDLTSRYPKQMLPKKPKPSTVSKQNKTIAIVKFKSFLLQFILLHGQLFTWTTSSRKSIHHLLSSGRKSNILSVGDESVSDFSVDDDLNVDSYFETMHKFLEELDHVITGPGVTDVLLLRMIVICIFTVHHSCDVLTIFEEVQQLGEYVDGTFFDAAMTNLSFKANRIISFSSKTHQHSKSESLALILIFGIVSRLSAKFLSLLESNGARIKKQAEKILPALALFCDWAFNYSHFLSVSPNSTNKAFDSERNTDTLSGSIERHIAIIKSKVLADADLLRSEGRSRSSMRSSFSGLKELFVKIFPQNVKDQSIDPKARIGFGMRTEEMDQIPLRHNVELRGFLPLEDYYEVLSKTAKIMVFGSGGTLNIFELRFLELPLFLKLLKFFNIADYFRHFNLIYFMLQYYFSKSEALDKMPDLPSKDFSLERCLRVIQSFLFTVLIPGVERERLLASTSCFVNGNVSQDIQKATYIAAESYISGDISGVYKEKSKELEKMSPKGRRKHRREERKKDLRKLTADAEDAEFVSIDDWSRRERGDVTTLNRSAVDEKNFPPLPMKSDLNVKISTTDQRNFWSTQMLGEEIFGIVNETRAFGAEGSSGCGITDLPKTKNQSDDESDVRLGSPLIKLPNTSIINIFSQTGENEICQTSFSSSSYMEPSQSYSPFSDAQNFFGDIFISQVGGVSQSSRIDHELVDCNEEVVDNVVFRPAFSRINGEDSKNYLHDSSNYLFESYLDPENAPCKEINFDSTSSQSESRLFGAWTRDVRLNSLETSHQSAILEVEKAREGHSADDSRNSSCLNFISHERNKVHYYHLDFNSDRSLTPNCNTLTSQLIGGYSENSTRLNIPLNVEGYAEKSFRLYDDIIVPSTSDGDLLPPPGIPLPLHTSPPPGLTENPYTRQSSGCFYSSHTC